MKNILLLATLCMPVCAFAQGNHGEHACEDNVSAGFPCSHAELLGHLSRAELGATDTTDLEDGVSDLWGWTDPETGREYVIVGMRNGPAFVDVTDPQHPKFLGRLQLPSLSAIPGDFELSCHDDCGDDDGKGAFQQMDIKTFGHHAYIVSERAGFGMQIFDLHQLRGVSSPQDFFADSSLTSFGNAHNLFINEDSGYAYVVGNTTEGGATENNPNFGGLKIFNLEDPQNPAFIASYDDIQYIHDVQCVMYEGPDADYQGHEICFASNSGYLRDDNGDAVVVDVIDGDDYYLQYSRMAVLDVTDKSNVRELSRTVFFEEPVVWWWFYNSYVHQAWLTEDNAFLMVNDEIADAVNETRTHSYVVDVRDLDAIKLHADYIHPTRSITHNEYVKGRLSYQANYRAGLRVLDVSAPDSPVQVAYFDTQPSTDEPGFEGTWTAYPFFSSDTIAISDMHDGLYLVRTLLTEPEPFAPDVAVMAELLTVEGADDQFYVDFANNGPMTATEVDFTFHLPDEFAFSDVVAPEGMTCSGAGRVVTCRMAEMPACATGSVSLPLEVSEMDADAEIVAMAAAREIETEGNTANNVARIKVSEGGDQVDFSHPDDLLAEECKTPLTIDAGEDISVSEGDPVSLAMVAEAADLVSSIAWHQVEGPAVDLSGVNAMEVSFTAPDVDAQTNLVFRVDVANRYRQEAEDSVTVTVQAKSQPPSQPGGGGNGGGGGLLYFLGLGLLAIRRRI